MTPPEPQAEQREPKVAPPKAKLSEMSRNVQLVIILAYVLLALMVLVVGVLILLSLHF